MKQPGLVLTATLAVGLVLVPAASWGGGWFIVVKGGALHAGASGAAVGPLAAGALVLGSAGGGRAFGSAMSDGPTYLIVDAYPAGAQVLLDGRLLGTAGELVARAVPLAPGKHEIEVVATGFRPYGARFGVARGSFPRRLRVTLVPE